MARKAKGEGTISKLRDGSYCGRLTVGYDDDGKQKRKAFYGKTKHEVIEKMNAAKEESDKENFVINPDKIIVGEWLLFWVEKYKKRSVRLSTYHLTKSNIIRHIIPALGAIKLKDLKTEAVQKFINDLSDNGLSRASIRIVKTALHGGLAQALQNGLVSKNAASQIKLPKEEKTEMRVLTLDEQLRFINAAKQYPMGDIFILMLATGLRSGEVRALVWSDIDFKIGTLSVNKTFSYYHDLENQTVGSPINPTKTKAGGRVIPLLPNVLKMLRKRYLATHKLSDYVFKDTSNYKQNEYISQGKASYWLTKILKDAELGDWVHLHTLRHTFATRGLENGIELKVMQELLGHGSINITADTYTHVLPDKKRDSMMKLAHMITPSEPLEIGE